MKGESMTLDEAIRHAEEVAEGYEKDISKWEYTLSEYRKRECVEQTTIPRCEKELNRCKQCASEHRQLAEWLKDYKRLKEQEPCGDAVSRQWLMRKATEKFYTTNYFNRITKMIEEAPSVNPQPYEDAISRDTVLKQLKGCLTGGETEYKYVKMHIDSIPPVKPQERTGKWIKMPLIETGQKFSHKCSLCGRTILAADTELSEFPYCHCGARMIKPQERSRND